MGPSSALPPSTTSAKNSVKDASFRPDVKGVIPKTERPAQSTQSKDHKDTAPRRSTISKLTKILVGGSTSTTLSTNVSASKAVEFQRQPSRDRSRKNRSNSTSSERSYKSVKSTISLSVFPEEGEVSQIQQQQQHHASNRTKSVKSIKHPEEKGSTHQEIKNLLGPPTVKRSESSASTSSSRSQSSSTASARDKGVPRFQLLENGKHEHYLKNRRRQERFGSIIKDFLGAKKLRDGAVSALPGFYQDSNNIENNSPQINGIIGQDMPDGKEGTTILDPRSFAEKYGRCQEEIGRGAFGVVRVSHKHVDGDEQLFAVKEFRKKPQENEKKYNRRLTSEFCISSSLHHPNIIRTLDLLKDAKGDFCQVMEFCTGGDLYSLIVSAGKLEAVEADCFFKQLMKAVMYMHEMGVVHRDLKPENLLLSANGSLKVTDFGNSECFRIAWEKEVHKSSGVCGSAPYISPEEYTDDEFDPRPVDVWSCGVIYMAMRTGRQLWHVAIADEDEFYKRYLEGRKSEGGYEPIEQLKRSRCRNVIYSILDPVPSRRITAKQVLNSEWGRSIKVCEAGEHGF